MSDNEDNGGGGCMRGLSQRITAPIRRWRNSRRENREELNMFGHARTSKVTPMTFGDSPLTRSPRDAEDNTPAYRKNYFYFYQTIINFFTNVFALT